MRSTKGKVSSKADQAMNVLAGGDGCCHCFFQGLNFLKSLIN